MGRGLPAICALHNHQPDSPLILHNDKTQAEALHHLSWLMQHSDKCAFRRIADGRLGSAALICSLSYNVHTSQYHVYDMQYGIHIQYSHAILSSAASSPRGLPSALQRHTNRPSFRSLSHLSLTGMPHWGEGRRSHRPMCLPPLGGVASKDTSTLSRTSSQPHASRLHTRELQLMAAYGVHQRRMRLLLD